MLCDEKRPAHLISRRTIKWNGKFSACPSVSPAVRQHYVERLAIYEMEKLNDSVV
jgi:hypothetical protein